MRLKSWFKVSSIKTHHLEQIFKLEKKPYPAPDVNVKRLFTLSFYEKKYFKNQTNVKFNKEVSNPPQIQQRMQSHAEFNEIFFSFMENTFSRSKSTRTKSTAQSVQSVPGNKFKQIHTHLKQMRDVVFSNSNIFPRW